MSVLFNMRRNLFRLQNNLTKAFSYSRSQDNKATQAAKISSFITYDTEVRDCCKFNIENPSYLPYGEIFFWGRISGWIVGKNIEVNCIEIFSNESFLSSIPVNVNRPDVATHLSLNTLNEKVGFSAYLNPLLLPEHFKIEGFAVTSDLQKIKIFSMRGERKLIHREIDFEIRPLLLTTLGRTGSTYLLGLLAAHPEITVYKPFQVEARYASYWMQMFLSFSQANSWLFPIASYDIQDPAWIFGNEDANQLQHALYPEMLQWFDGQYIENLYRFCVYSLQDHYCQVAYIQNKKDANFFAEKFLPNAFTAAVLELLPNAKEIILVRDFRDMFCSIRNFNKKRGFSGFGMDKSSSDEDYISTSLLGSAEALLQAWKKRQSQSLLIRYKDLILEPETTIRKIFEYLEIDKAPSTVRKVIKSAARTNTEQQKHHKTSQSAKNSVERFRRELEPRLLELCNDTLGDVLTAFGYRL